MDISDYLRAPAGLALLFQLQQQPCSASYLKEKRIAPVDVLRDRLQEAKSLSLIHEEREDGTVTYHLTESATTLLERLEEEPEFSRRDYLNTRGDLKEARQTVADLEEQIDRFQDAAESVVSKIGTETGNEQITFELE